MALNSLRLVDLVVKGTAVFSVSSIENMGIRKDCTPAFRITTPVEIELDLTNLIIAASVL